MSLSAVKLVPLPTRVDARGALAVVQGTLEIPFAIKRLFYTYNVGRETERGNHAHRETEQFVISIAGNFWLELSDGYESREYQLDSPDRGVYIPTLVWTKLHSFSPGSVYLVLANTLYSESDYIRDWQEYLSLVRGTSRE